jgi:hypothetical protein
VLISCIQIYFGNFAKPFPKIKKWVMSVGQIRAALYSELDTWLYEIFFLKKTNTGLFFNCSVLDKLYSIRVVLKCLKL